MRLQKEDLSRQSPFICIMRRFQRGSGKAVVVGSCFPSNSAVKTISTLQCIDSLMSGNYASSCYADYTNSINKFEKTILTFCLLSERDTDVNMY